MLGTAGLLAGCDLAPAQVPLVALAPIPGLKLTSGWQVPAIDTSRFQGRVTVLNVWASWCPYCRGEHDLVKSLAGRGNYTLAGLVHQDSAENALNYLLQAGNPYAEVSVDEKSSIYIPLRQRGVPHTYVIGRDLKVVAKVPGALSEQAIESVILPAARRASISAA